MIKRLIRSLAPMIVIGAGIHSMDIGVEARSISLESYTSAIHEQPMPIEVAAPELQAYARAMFERNREMYVALHTKPAFSDRDYECLKDTVVREAPADYEGMQAVATVIWNRVHDKRYPHTFCGVVNQKQDAGYEIDPETGKYLLDDEGYIKVKKEVCQFTANCEPKDYPIARMRWQLADKVTLDVLRYHKIRPGFEGVLYYMNPKVAKDRYNVSEDRFMGDSRCLHTVIGPHSFYTDCSNRS